MKRWTTVLLALALAAVAVTLVVAQDVTDDERALRTRIEDRFDVVPLSDGIALRPKKRRGDVRLIEISGGVIAINGVLVSGRELRDRVGEDADPILRLSYLSAEQRRGLFGGAREAEAERAEAPDSFERTDPSRGSRGRRASGDRVRVFGDVVVQEDEEISGDVVAVLGSVRVDGVVRREVVAVLGSVNLGPKAIVHGDVVSVGGRVRRAAGAQVRGAVTDISLGDTGLRLNVGPWLGPVHLFDGFGAVPRLIGSSFRMLLLLLLASIALVVARPSVENSAQRLSDNPAKAVLVGLAAEVLVFPVMLLTATFMIVSVIGIPLLLLLPFVMLLLVLMALVGFTGTAYTLGQATRRRFGMAGQSPFTDVGVGILIILLPLLLGRVVALAGWPANPFAWLLIATGVGVEFLAWTGGFGAVLNNVFSRWRARRMARRTVEAPPATP